MALDLTGLSAYTDENAMDLIARSVLKGRTIETISVQPGIKSAAAINILENVNTWQAGACGFNASGDTTLTQRTITVSDIKQNQVFCLNDLEGFYTQKMMKAGSYNEELPFEALFTDHLIALHNKEMELLAWQGDTLGAGNLALADGLLKIIDAAVGVVTGTTLALDASNIIDAVDEMVAAIPSDAISSDDLFCFMGYPEYRIYAKALRDANLFAYSGAENQGAEFSQYHPGTNVRVIGVGGLDGLGRAVLCEASNLYMGTDLMNDAEAFRLFYSEDNDEVRLIMKFKAGFQIAYPERIVISA